MHWQFHYLSHETNGRSEFNTSSTPFKLRLCIIVNALFQYNVNWREIMHEHRLNDILRVFGGKICICQHLFENHR